MTFVGSLYLMLEYAKKRMSLTDITHDSLPLSFPFPWRIISVDCEGAGVRFRTRQFGIAELRSQDVEGLPFRHWHEKMKGLVFAIS